MNNLTNTRIQKWCKNSGWTDLFVQEGQFYAFPPGAVIPLPVPTEAIKLAKTLREIMADNLKKILLIIVHFISSASS